MAFKNLNKRINQIVSRCFFVLSILFLLHSSSWSAYASDVCEEHSFGDTSVQWYVYPDGKSWNFEAEKSISVKEIRVVSVLASNGGTFNIQVDIS